MGSQNLLPIELWRVNKNCRRQTDRVDLVSVVGLVPANRRERRAGLRMSAAILDCRRQVCRLVRDKLSCVKHQSKASRGCRRKSTFAVSHCVAMQAASVTMRVATWHMAEVDVTSDDDGSRCLLTMTEVCLLTMTEVNVGGFRLVSKSSASSFCPSSFVVRRKHRGFGVEPFMSIKVRNICRIN